MCRLIGVDKEERIWKVPLNCTTNADRLYNAAVEAAERLALRLRAIEPCLWAFATAVRPREEWPWKPTEDDQKAERGWQY